MKNVFLIRIELEKCRADKRKTDLIMPHTALHYIVDGYGYFNGTRLGPGQFFCAAKNEKVCYYPEKENPWAYIYVDFDGEGLSELMKQCGFAEGRVFGDFAFIDEMMKIEQLYRSYSQKALLNKAFLDALGNMILSFHDTKWDNGDEHAVPMRHVNKIREYINFNFHKNITIEEISRKFYLSRAYMRNIFDSYMKMSPKQYLQTVRMEKAAELLKSTKYQVSEIAMSVGYEDSLAFSKAFKNYYGISPLQYRHHELN